MLAMTIFGSKLNKEFENGVCCCWVNLEYGGGCVEEVVVVGTRNG